MKKFTLSLCILFALAVPAAAQPEKKTLSAAGCVMVKSASGGWSCGTCFFVKQDKEHLWAVTCAHVVSDRRFAAVFVPQFDEKGRVITLAKYYTAKADGLTAEVVHLDRKRDIAVLKVRAAKHAASGRVETADLAKFPELSLKALTSPAVQREAVWAVGNADLFEGSMFQVARLEPIGLLLDRFGWMDRSEGNVRHGYSGGPVFDEQGRVIGMTSLGYVNNFLTEAGLVKVDAIHDALSRAGCSLPTPAAPIKR